MSKQTDAFDCVIGGNPAKANEVLSETPKSMDQIIAEGGLTGPTPTVYDHFNRMIEKGYVAKHGNPPCKYSLTSEGMARKGKAISKPKLNVPVALYSVDPTIVWKDGRVFKQGVFVGIFSDADEFQKALNEKTQEAIWLQASQRKDWPKQMEFPEK